MIVARFHGGPLDDDNRLAPNEVGWPLPDEFRLALISDEQVNFMIGYYSKTNQSELPDEVASANPGLMRGAEYTWREEDEVD